MRAAGVLGVRWSHGVPIPLAMVRTTLQPGMALACSRLEGDISDECAQEDEAEQTHQSGGSDTIGSHVWNELSDT